MVALLSLGLSAAGTLTIIAVAWGVFSTRLGHLEKRTDTMETTQKEHGAKASDTDKRVTVIESALKKLDDIHEVVMAQKSRRRR